MKVRRLRTVIMGCIIAACASCAVWADVAAPSDIIRYEFPWLIPTIAVIIVVIIAVRIRRRKRK